MRFNPGISGLENFQDPGIPESRDPGIAIPNGDTHIPWTTIRAQLSLLDKYIDMSARFYAYIAQKSHNKMQCIFLTESAYAPYATCTATSPLMSDAESLPLETNCAYLIILL